MPNPNSISDAFRSWHLQPVLDALNAAMKQDSDMQKDLNEIRKDVNDIQKTVNDIQKTVNALQSTIQNIKQEVHQVAMNQTDLDNALKALGDIVAGEDSLIQQIITSVNALIDKINAGTPPADLTTEVTALQSLVSDVTTQSQSLTDSINKAKGVTG